MTTNEFAQRLSSRIGSVGSVEDLLNALGLEPRRTATQATTTASAWFAAGILVGAGLALLLAPRGVEARGSVGSARGEGSQPLTQM